MHAGSPGSDATKPSCPGKTAPTTRVAFLCLSLGVFLSTLHLRLCAFPAGHLTPAGLAHPVPPLSGRASTSLAKKACPALLHKGSATMTLLPCCSKRPSPWVSLSA